MVSDDEIYALIGEDGFARLVAAFNAQVPGDDILGPRYPAADMAGVAVPLGLGFGGMGGIGHGGPSAAGLHGRLQRGGARGAPDLVRRLALQVAALGRALDSVRADEPEDALIELRPADPRSPRDLAWRDRLAAMYRQWAEARGLRVHALATEATVAALRLEVSGFGAWQGLRGEAGAHLLERREGEQEQRASVRVLVAPVPGQMPTAEAETRICRRYDDGASPLVRDTRGWRTGRPDRVLAGDFHPFHAY